MQRLAEIRLWSDLVSEPVSSRKGANRRGSAARCCGIRQSKDCSKRAWNNGGGGHSRGQNRFDRRHVLQNGFQGKNESWIFLKINLNEIWELQLYPFDSHRCLLILGSDNRHFPRLKVGLRLATLKYSGRDQEPTPFLITARSPPPSPRQEQQNGSNKQFSETVKIEIILEQ